MRRPKRHQLHINAPDSLNADTARLVLEFANALAAKLAKAEEKYGYTNGWLTQDWEDECRQHMLNHIEKGDPLDVAAYCAFMWRRRWPTVRKGGGEWAKRTERKVKRQRKNAEKADD